MNSSTVEILFFINATVVTMDSVATAAAAAAAGTAAAGRELKVGAKAVRVVAAGATTRATVSAPG